MDKNILNNEFEKVQEELSQYIDESFRKNYAKSVMRKINAYYDSSTVSGIVSKEEQVFFIDYLNNLQNKMRKKIVSAMAVAGDNNEASAMSYWYLAESEVDSPELIPLNFDFDFSSVPSRTKSSDTSKEKTNKSGSSRSNAVDIVTASVSTAAIVGGIAAPLPTPVKVGLIIAGVGGLAYEGVNFFKDYNSAEDSERQNVEAGDNRLIISEMLKGICLPAIRENANANGSLLKEWVREMCECIFSKVRG